jgi:hypothetical protein
LVELLDCCMQLFKLSVELASGFAALVHVVIQLDVGFAATTDEHVPKAGIPVENFGPEVAPWTLHFELKSVQFNQYTSQCDANPVCVRSKPAAVSIMAPPAAIAPYQLASNAPPPPSGDRYRLRLPLRTSAFGLEIPMPLTIGGAIYAACYRY